MVAIATPLTTRQAARRLDVVPQTIRRWVKAGRLDGEKVGDRVLVEEASVAALEHQDERPKP